MGLTDYLEEILDNAEALLEQVRRMGQGLPGPARRMTGEMADVSPADGEEAVPEKEPGRRAAVEEAEGGTARTADWEDLVYQEERARTEPEERAAGPGPVPEGGDRAPELPRRGRTALEVPRRIRTPLETAEGETSPLLDQVQRLERAAGRAVQPEPSQGRDTGIPQTAGGLALPRTGPAFPDAPGAPEEGRSGFVRSGVSAAAELRWAEQADRAFRRDSRRYDGGFYLY